MKEEKILFALKNYFKAIKDLEDARSKLKFSALNKDTVHVLAKLVASHYNCQFVTTSTGNISFCDSLSEPVLTRRDDARKFWRRNIFGDTN